MSSHKDFEIPFESLGIGKHEFKFEITDSFFEELTYSIIEGATVEVDFILDKREMMLVGDFHLKGVVRKACDRCSDTMDIDIETSHQIIYKFEEEISEDEDLVNVPKNSHFINIQPEIYELLTVSLPSRSVHEEGGCSEEMLDLLDKYVYLSDDDIDDSIEDTSDPRWDALRKLK